MDLTHRLRLCAGCRHWSKYPEVHKDGYLIAYCRQPEDERDHKMKRASDSCSRWQTNAAD